MGFHYVAGLFSGILLTLTIFFLLSELPECVTGDEMLCIERME